MKVHYFSDSLTTFEKLSPGDCFYRPIEEPDGDIYMKTNNCGIDSAVNITTGETFGLSPNCEVARVNAVAQITKYGD